MLDILCVGDSKVDIFIRIPETNSHFGFDKEKNQLLITLGEKISVDRYVVSTGGNATNTAVGVSRLGFNAGICAEIGKDEFSGKILNKLKAENINTDLMLQNDKEKTSLSVILTYNGERTILSEHIERNHNFNFQNTETKFIYLTSLGNLWENAYEKTLEIVTKNNLKLAFNPGTLQIEKRDKLIMDIIEKTDYLFVNKEEAEELLYGKELGLEMKDDKSLVKKLLFGLKSLGAKNIIITDSNNGSYVENENNETYYLGVLKEKVVEKTGAGDSYTAGFLAAILNGLLITDAMVWGTLNATNVVGKIGAQEGLFTKAELLDKIKTLNNFSPKNF